MAGSVAEALRTGNLEVLPEHLLTAILRSPGCEAAKALSELGTDVSSLKRAMDSRVFRSRALPFEAKQDIAFSREAAAALNRAALEAVKAGCSQTGTLHLLLALSLGGTAFSLDLGDTAGITPEAVKGFIKEETAGTEEAGGCPSAEEIARAVVEQLELQGLALRALSRGGLPYS